MRSPFPGMDPYLEDPAVWEEFHHVFLAECMHFLGGVLPERYVARVGERVGVISIDDEAAAQYLPDVALARLRRQRREAPGGAAATGATATLALPVTIPAVDDLEVREGFVEILRMPEHELVAAVELLSPWNKFGEGIGTYRDKRRALVSRGVHVAELDLLRRGTRTALARPLPAGDYYALVFRGDRRPDVEVYAWGLRDPLPTIPLPLREPDGPVSLDLAAVVASTYERGYFARKVRYGAPVPPPALAAEDAEWARTLLA